MTEVNNIAEPRVPAFMINFIEKVAKHSVSINASGMLLASLTSSNPAKGLAYVVLLGLAIFVRIGFLMLTSYSGPYNASQQCVGDLPGQLSFYDGGRNNIYILSFSLFYLGLPMLLAKAAKWHYLLLLVIQLSLICFVAHGKNCISSYVIFLIEIVGGAIFGSVVSVIMYYAGLKSWLMISGIPDAEAEAKKNEKKSLRCKIRPLV